MKPLFILLILLSTQFALAAEEKVVPVKEANKVQSGVVINDTLKKLLEVKGVQPVYETCLKNNSNNQEAIPDCIWRNLDDKLKKTVQETYTAEIKKNSGGRAPASGTDISLTTKQEVVSTNYSTDPAVEALSNFYKTKLDAVLNPQVALTAEEQKNGAILNTDHRQYIDLYKSALGKTIINAFTSYCLDTDPANCECTATEAANCAANKEDCKCEQSTCSISDNEADRKVHRGKNLDGLKNLDLNSSSAAAMKWRMCISSVTNACAGKVKPNVTINTETKNRSCLVMDYVESARTNIMYADKQKTFYDDLAKDRPTNIVSNAKGITDKTKNSSDALLEMTSTDVEKSLKDPLEKTAKEFEECYKEDDQKNGQIVNADACKKYLNTNTDENNAALAELGMRYNAQGAIIEEELKKDDTKVSAYLLEEGYTKEQAAAMTKDAASIEKVRQEIIERYKSQKDAIIADMAEKIKTKSSTTDGKIDATKDMSKLAAIKADLTSRASDFQNLVKFNNVISSYMEVSSNGKVERNTASLYAESNAMKEADSKELKDSIKKAKLSDQKGTSNTVDFEVDKINSVLKYKAEDELEAAKKKGN